jgi:hypothetical protein
MELLEYGRHRTVATTTYKFEYGAKAEQRRWPFSMFPAEMPRERDQRTIRATPRCQRENLAAPPVPACDMQNERLEWRDCVIIGSSM